LDRSESVWLEKHGKTKVEQAKKEYKNQSEETLAKVSFRL
jgi:hypothetical protein